MRERGREQRRAKRTRRRNAAWIGLGNGGTRIPCVLWDISDTGARLAAPRTNVLPATFHLLLSKEGHLQRKCRVVWRNDRQVGVRFIEEIPDLDDDRHRRQSNVAPPSGGASVATAALVLPGYGPQFLEQPARGGIPTSSFAAAMLGLLVVATVVFFVAGMQTALDAPWALQLCASTGNLCRHPEWTGAAVALMTVVYLAVRGMET